MVHISSQEMSDHILLKLMRRLLQVNYMHCIVACVATAVLPIQFCFTKSQLLFFLPE